MSRYLEEAAALLRKAAETNERENARWPESLATGRERIAREFATLAAIDNRLLPAEMIAELELNRLETAESAGRALIDLYLAARRLGDELGMRRYEALAADHDLLYPDSPISAELDGLHTPATDVIAA